MLFWRKSGQYGATWWQHGSEGTYVDTPELLDAVEADDLLQKLVPVLLAAWRLGEPERPGVLESVLDGEVVGVVEDGDDLAVGSHWRWPPPSQRPRERWGWCRAAQARWA